MKTILLIIAFCGGVALAQQADTLKLSNGLSVLLSNGQAVLLAGGSPPPPTPATGGWLNQVNGRKLFFNNGRAILTRQE